MTHKEPTEATRMHTQRSRADAGAEDDKLRRVFGIFRAVCPLWSD